MKYLKKFENHSSYTEFQVTDEFIKPNVSHCVEENDVHYNPIDYSKEFLTIESIEDENEVYFKASNSSITRTISVSTDNGKTWTEYTSSTGGSGTTIATLNSGEKALVKGENTSYGTTSHSNYFKSTKQFEVKGNIMSLTNGDYFTDANALAETYTFKGMFSGCTELISADKLVLPATTLANSCYSNMFYNCTNLTTTPQLPATALTNYCYDSMFYRCKSLTTPPDLLATTLAESCYTSMFAQCTSLTTAPELPATTLANYCYSGMFYNCSNLTTPPELPATTLAYECYSGMFQGCRNLTSAPQLVATKLAESCYSQMFTDCTSLTTAPELPATTLAKSCYRSMFSGCKNLTAAPELLATALKSSCYSYMFFNCSKINRIKAMFTTTPSTTYTQNWVSGVTSTGTFVKNAAATWDVSGVNGIPTNWTVLTATA